ncbi:hypothetical protein F2Q68_00021111 [Brassica cretica]|uniref:Uncharacterized protein n=1 Tax=Brassica cretica TaxID=69181 RepID=A0A8S9FS77_BRACR|nr:hypothetical protein F2Q68_00021111 [Brassica cretica]
MYEPGDSLTYPEIAGWNPEAFEAVLESRGLDPEIAVWNPEEPGGSSLDPEIFDWNPEAIEEPGDSSLDFMHRTQNWTVLRLPRQDYYWYQFGFRILPLGSWPLSSSYDVFYFCRKSLTGLEGAGVGVMTQVPGLRCSPSRSILIQVLFTLVLWGRRCALGCTGVLGPEVSYAPLRRMSAYRYRIKGAIQVSPSSTAVTSSDGGSSRAFEAVLEPGGLDPEIAVWNPEEPGGSSLDPEIFDWKPEAIGEPGVSSLDFMHRTRNRTVLRLPRQDYYWYLFGFRIPPLGSWPLSSSYDVFYFCRKSLTGLEGAGVCVMTQVSGLRYFPRLEKQDLDCSLYFSHWYSRYPDAPSGAQGFQVVLTAYSGLRIPIHALCLIPVLILCGRATFCEGWP